MNSIPVLYPKGEEIYTHVIGDILISFHELTTCLVFVAMQLIMVIKTWKKTHFENLLDKSTAGWGIGMG